MTTPQLDFAGFFITFKAFRFGAFRQLPQGKYLYFLQFSIICRVNQRGGQKRPRQGDMKRKQERQMLKSTKDAITAIAATDPSINATQLKVALAELDGEGIREMQGEPPPRSYSPAQVAALLGVSRRTVGAYRRRGLLTPLYTGKDGKRAQAYTGASVAALLNGKTTAANESEVCV